MSTNYQIPIVFPVNCYGYADAFQWDTCIQRLPLHEIQKHIAIHYMGTKLAIIFWFLANFMGYDNEKHDLKAFFKPSNHDCISYIAIILCNSRSSGTVKI